MEELHNHPENRSADDPSRNIDDSLALPAPECTLTREGSRESRGSGGRSTTGTEVAPIDLLPNELLLVIFELYTGQDTQARNLVPLSLVCKLWRDLVEGTASLWCRISGSDGLPCLRKGLGMAKDVPLEIKYLEQVAKTDTETFFAEIGGRIAQWKSLDVGATKWDPVLAALKQANTPKLKTLNLRAPWGQYWGGNVVILFGGEPASVALKDLHVESIPLAIAPLRLSRLRSLKLQGEPIISTEEILRVLRGSPGLKQCDLIHLTCLRNAGFALPSHILDYPTIQLSHLRSLNLRGLPISITHFILSVIRAPKLRKVSVDCTIDQPDQSPASDLFTTKISHLIPSLKDLVKTAERIEVLSYNGRNWTFSIGRLMIGLGGRRPQLRHLQEMLDWVFRNLGGHLRALPGSLKVHEFEVGSGCFIWLASHLKVTKLDLQAGLVATLQVNREIVSLLSRPLESANNQWLLPDLESIKINAGNENGRSKILEMVHARHSYVDEQGEGKTEGTVLKPFQEIWLRSGKIPVRKVLGPDLEFLTAVQKAGRGVKIWWEDVEWTGTECESRVGEVEGSA